MAQNLKTYSVAVTSDLSGMKGVGKDMANEVKPGIDSMGEADGKMSGIAGNIGMAFAAIGVAAAAAFAVAVKGAWDAATAAASYADDMMTMASVTGISTDALQEFNYMAELTDVSLSTIQGASTKNVKSMYAAQEGTGAAADAYKRLGISVADTDGNLRDSNDVFMESIAALGEIENETERDALAMQLFGKSARDLNPMIELGAENLASLRQEAHDMGAVMDGETLDALGNLDDGMQRIQSRTDALKNNMGAHFAPAFTGAIDIVNAAFEVMGGDIAKLPEALETMIPQMASYIEQQAPQLMDSAMSLVTSIAMGILDSLPSLVTTAMSIIVSLVQGIAAAAPQLIPAIVEAILGMMQALIDSLPTFLQAGLDLIVGLATGVMQAIPTLVAMLPQIIESMITFFADAIPQIIEAGIQLLLALVENLPAIIDGIVAAIPQIIDALISFFTGPAIPSIIEAGIELLLALIENLPTIIDSIVAAIPQIIDALVKFFTGPAIPQIIDAGVKLLIALVQNLPAIIMAILKAIPQIISSLVSAIGSSLPQIIDAGVNLLGQLFQNMGAIWSNIQSVLSGLPGKIVSTIGGWVGQMISAGGNLIRGLANGLSPGVILDKIRSICAGAINAIKNFFGIHSPSTVMADLGQYIPLGLAKGVDSTADSAVDSITSMMDDMIAEAQVGIGAVELDANATASKITGSIGSSEGTTINNLYLDGNLLHMNDQESDALDVVFSTVKRNINMGRAA